MRSQNKPPTKPNQTRRTAVPPLSAKRLAHEVGIDVRTLRHVLRAKYRPEGVQGNNYWGPWLWTDPKEIEAVRRYVMYVFGSATEKPSNQRKGSP